MSNYNVYIGVNINTLCILLPLYVGGKTLLDYRNSFKVLNDNAGKCVCSNAHMHLIMIIILIFASYRRTCCAVPELFSAKIPAA